MSKSRTGSRCIAASDLRKSATYFPCSYEDHSSFTLNLVTF